MYERYSKILSDSPSQKTFKTYFGEIKNLRELNDHLSQKGDLFYNTYAYGDTNHFSNWIAGVFEDHELAAKLKGCDTYEKASKAISERLAYLDFWMADNSRKETLTRYLVDSYVFNSESFSPSHHSYMTLENFEPGVSGIISPPSSILPTIIKSPEEAPKLAGYNPELHIKPFDSKFAESRFDEKTFVKNLNEHFPKFSVTNEKAKVERGMLQKFNVFKRFRF